MPHSIIVVYAMVKLYHCRIRPVYMYYPTIIKYSMYLLSVVHNGLSLGVLISYFIVYHPTPPRVKPIM